MVPSRAALPRDFLCCARLFLLCQLSLFYRFVASCTSALLVRCSGVLQGVTLPWLQVSPLRVSLLQMSLHMGSGCTMGSGGDPYALLSMLRANVCGLCQ